MVRVLYVTRAPDNTVLLVAHGLKRFRIAEWISGKNFLKAKIKLTPETIESDIETDALYRNLRDLTQEIFSLSLDVPKEAVDELRRVKDKLYLTYIAAAHSEIDFETRQALLEEDSLKAKLRKLLKILSREKEILSLGKKIKTVSWANRMKRNPGRTTTSNELKNRTCRKKLARKPCESWSD